MDWTWSATASSRVRTSVRCSSMRRQPGQDRQLLEPLAAVTWSKTPANLTLGIGVWASTSGGSNAAIAMVNAAPTRYLLVAAPSRVTLRCAVEMPIPIASIQQRASERLSVALL